MALFLEKLEKLLADDLGFHGFEIRGQGHCIVSAFFGQGDVISLFAFLISHSLDSKLGFAGTAGRAGFAGIRIWGFGRNHENP
jgi:hypothetical protein